MYMFCEFLDFMRDMLSFLSACIDGSWKAPLTLVAMVIRGWTSQPFCVESLDEWVTFGGFLEAIAVGNLS